MMKLTLLVLCATAALLTACASHDNRNRNIYEPSGAEVTTNTVPERQARDINQMPYPGTRAPDPGYGTSFDMQRNLNSRGPSGAQSFDMTPQAQPPEQR